MTFKRSRRLAKAHTVSSTKAATRKPAKSSPWKRFVLRAKTKEFRRLQFGEFYLFWIIFVDYIVIFSSEISLLKELKHANIVSLMDVLMEDNRLYLIFEFLSMDLKKYMDSLPAERMMDPELVRSYLYQITAAMLFCHRRRVLHRDLKVECVRSNWTIF